MHIGWDTGSFNSSKTAPVSNIDEIEIKEITRFS